MNKQRSIVVTSVAHVKSIDGNKHYQVGLNMQVDGEDRLVTVDITKYEKRHAYNVHNMRDVIYGDRAVEGLMQTAAAYAFEGEQKFPMVIST